MSRKIYTGNEGTRDLFNGDPMYALTIKHVLKNTAITVGTTPTALPSSNLAGRMSIVIYNNGSATVYIGNSTVSTSNGYPIAAGGQLFISIEEEVTIYCVVASATADVRILEGE